MDKINKIRDMIKKGRDNKPSKIEEAYDSSMEWTSSADRRTQGSNITHVDTSDVRPVSQLDDPETFSRMNGYVSKANCITADPWKIIRKMHYKLHLVGLNFNLSDGDMQLPEEPMTYVFDLSFYGGSYGPKPDGEWTDDDGFDGSYVLAISLDPIGDGTWEIEAGLMRGEDIEYDDDLVDMQEECDCDEDCDCDDEEELEEENIQEEISGYGLSDSAQDIYDMIDGDRDFMKPIDKINDKLVKRGWKKYNRRSAMTMFKAAIYDAIELLQKHDELSNKYTPKASMVLELAGFYADMIEEDLSETSESN